MNSQQIRGPALTGSPFCPQLLFNRHPPNSFLSKRSTLTEGIPSTEGAFSIIFSSFAAVQPPISNHFRALKCYSAFKPFIKPTNGFPKPFLESALSNLDRGKKAASRHVRSIYNNRFRLDNLSIAIVTVLPIQRSSAAPWSSDAASRDWCRPLPFGSHFRNNILNRHIVARTPSTTSGKHRNRKCLSQDISNIRRGLSALRPVAF